MTTTKLNDLLLNASPEAMQAIIDNNKLTAKQIKKVSNLIKEAKEAAKEAAKNKEAKFQASIIIQTKEDKEAKEAAKAAKVAKEAAKEAAKVAKEAKKQATKEAKITAKEAAKAAKEETKEAKAKVKIKFDELFSFTGLLNWAKEAGREEVEEFISKACKQYSKPIFSIERVNIKEIISYLNINTLNKFDLNEFENIEMTRKTKFTTNTLTKALENKIRNKPQISFDSLSKEEQTELLNDKEAALRLAAKEAKAKAAKEAKVLKIGYSVLEAKAKAAKAAKEAKAKAKAEAKAKAAK